MNRFASLWTWKKNIKESTQDRRAVRHSEHPNLGSTLHDGHNARLPFRIRHSTRSEDSDWDFGGKQSSPFDGDAPPRLEIPGLEEGLDLPPTDNELGALSSLAAGAAVAEPNPSLPPNRHGVLKKPRPSSSSGASLISGLSRLGHVAAHHFSVHQTDPGLSVGFRDRSTTSTPETSTMSSSRINQNQPYQSSPLRDHRTSTSSMTTPVSGKPSSGIERTRRPESILEEQLPKRSVQSPSAAVVAPSHPSTTSTSASSSASSGAGQQPLGINGPRSSTDEGGTAGNSEGNNAKRVGLSHEGAVLVAAGESAKESRGLGIGLYDDDSIPNLRRGVGVLKRRRASSLAPGKSKDEAGSKEVQGDDSKAVAESKKGKSSKREGSIINGEKVRRHGGMAGIDHGKRAGGGSDIETSRNDGIGKGRTKPILRHAASSSSVTTASPSTAGLGRGSGSIKSEIASRSPEPSSLTSGYASDSQYNPLPAFPASSRRPFTRHTVVPTRSRSFDNINANKQTDVTTNQSRPFQPSPSPTTLSSRRLSGSSQSSPHSRRPIGHITPPPLSDIKEVQDVERSPSPARNRKAQSSKQPEPSYAELQIFDTDPEDSDSDFSFLRAKAASVVTSGSESGNNSASGSPKSRLRTKQLAPASNRLVPGHERERPSAPSPIPPSAPAPTPVAEEFSHGHSVSPRPSRTAMGRSDKASNLAPHEKDSQSESDRSQPHTDSRRLKPHPSLPPLVTNSLSPSKSQSQLRSQEPTVTASRPGTRPRANTIGTPSHSHKASSLYSSSSSHKVSGSRSSNHSHKTSHSSMYSRHGGGGRKDSSASMMSASSLSSASLQTLHTSDGGGAAFPYSDFSKGDKTDSEKFDSGPDGEGGFPLSLFPAPPQISPPSPARIEVTSRGRNRSRSISDVQSSSLSTSSKDPAKARAKSATRPRPIIGNVSAWPTPPMTPDEDGDSRPEDLDSDTKVKAPGSTNTTPTKNQTHSEREKSRPRELVGVLKKSSSATLSSMGSSTPPPAPPPTPFSPFPHSPNSFGSPLPSPVPRSHGRRARSQSRSRSHASGSTSSRAPTTPDQRYARLLYDSLDDTGDPYRDLINEDTEPLFTESPSPLRYNFDDEILGLVSSNSDADDWRPGRPRAPVGGRSNGHGRYESHSSGYSRYDDSTYPDFAYDSYLNLNSSASNSETERDDDGESSSANHARGPAHQDTRSSLNSGNSSPTPTPTDANNSMVSVVGDGRSSTPLTTPTQSASNGGVHFPSVSPLRVVRKTSRSTLSPSSPVPPQKPPPSQSKSLPATPERHTPPKNPIQLPPRSARRMHSDGEATFPQASLRGTHGAAPCRPVTMSVTSTTGGPPSGASLRSISRPIIKSTTNLSVANLKTLPLTTTRASYEELVTSLETSGVIVKPKGSPRASPLPRTVITPATDAHNDSQKVSTTTTASQSSAARSSSSSDSCYSQHSIIRVVSPSPGAEVVQFGYAV